MIACSRSKYAIAKDVLEHALRTGVPIQQVSPRPVVPKATQVAPTSLVEPELVGETGSGKVTGGKGGHQHLVMQERIKFAAEALGFTAVVEMPTEHGRESIDIGLVRDDIRIACEVSVSTTIDHEIGNARKCLKVGFDKVILVTADSRRREQLRQAVDGHFEPSEAAKVHCHSIEECLAFLDTCTSSQKHADDPVSCDPVVKGYTVRRTFTSLTPEEWNAKSMVAFELLRLEMKLPPP